MYSESIVSGLVAGLVVAFIVVLTRKIWDAVIVPWFEERIYKDIKIEGKWYGLYPEFNANGYRQDVVVLKRHGHTITGTMICTKGGEGAESDEGEEYNLSGSFRNMLLPLVYESSDLEKSDRGSLNMMCIYNGERFSGKICMYNTTQHSISSTSLLWFRKKEHLEETIQHLNAQEERRRQLQEQREQIEKEEQEMQASEDAQADTAESQADAS